MAELQQIAKASFGQLVKAVVDINKGIMVVGGDLHADQEKLLLEKGSKQQDLWGINLYPFLPEKDWIEYDSMINLRPSADNLTRAVDNPQKREIIRKVVSNLVMR